MIGRATADLHLSQRTAEWVFQALGELREDAGERGGWTVIVGDIFDQAKVMSMPLFNRLYDVFCDWPGELYVLAGNHDQYAGLKNCLQSMEGAVYLVEEPRETRIGWMIPYLPASEFWPTVKTFAPPTTPLLWTHQGWRGAYLNNMLRNKDGLSSRNLPEDMLIISGHYHMPQSIGPVIYCGSPYQLTFAEEGQQKSWLAWDDDHIPRRIPFEKVTAPRHVTVHWDPEAGPPLVPDDLRSTDIVRVITKATRVDAKRAVSQLAEVGLEGARLEAQPATDPERQFIDASAGVQSAADQYVDRIFGPTDVSPTEMDEWARENGLWD